jgi:hypothetical protein
MPTDGRYRDRPTSGGQFKHGAIHSARNVVRRVFTRVGAQPTSHRIDIDAEAKAAKNFLGHDSKSF